MRGRLVDHDSHGAFGRMGADIDHAAGESLVAHGRHRDQHLPVEIAALGRLAPLRPRRFSGADGLRDGHIAAAGRHIGFAAGSRRVAIVLSGGVLGAGLARELHVEMLPDCPPFANDARGRKFPIRIPCILCATMNTSSDQRHHMCLFHAAFQRRTGGDHARAHDEFNGMGKVSPLDRLVPRTQSSRTMCREYDRELRVQRCTRIIELLVVLDSEARIRTCGKCLRASESDH